MSDAWIGTVTAAAPRYFKGAMDATIRKRLILAMLQRRGKIVMNYRGSHESKFDVDYKEPPVEQFGDGGQVTYERNDYLKQGTIDWRGYKASDEMTIKEREETRGGDYVLVDRYKRIFPKLRKAIKNQIGLEFYVDGYASGNENRFCGIESFCGAGTCVVGDMVAQPSDTYFGLSTALNQSGRWSADAVDSPNTTVATDWPLGEGSTDYDYWSPKLANVVTTDARWSTTATWAANCKLALRDVIQWLALTAGVESTSLMAMLSGDYMSTFKASFDSSSRVWVPHKESEMLGFPTVLNFEGCGVHTEFGISTARGYVLNVDEVELCMLGKDIVSTVGPTWDPNSASWKFLAYCFGNFKFMPRHVAKLYPYAAA